MKAVTDSRWLAEFAADEETPFYWISPVPVSDSLETLIRIPETYLDPGEWRGADIGCGNGTLTAAAAEQYPEADVWATDLYAEAAGELESVYDNVTVEQGDMFNTVPLTISEDGRFDMVYAVNLLQATDDPRQTAALLHDATVPGGYAAVTVPGEAELLQQYIEDYLGYDEKLDLPYVEVRDMTVGDRTIDFKQHLFPDDSGQTILEAAGFDVLGTESLAADTRGLPFILETVGADPEQLPDDAAAHVDLYLLEA